MSPIGLAAVRHRWTRPRSSASGTFAGHGARGTGHRKIILGLDTETKNRPSGQQRRGAKPSLATCPVSGSLRANRRPAKSCTLWSERQLKCGYIGGPRRAPHEHAPLAAQPHQETTSPPAEHVASGSSLAKDDEGLIGNPVRSAARYGLLTAVDHLGLIADLAKDELTLRPSAIFTPARAALLGSSQAVWILTGRRPQRIDRSLAVALGERVQHRTFIRDHLNDGYIRDNLGAGFIDDLRRVDAELTGEVNRLKLLRKDTAYSGNFDTTRMMREAAAHLTKAGEVDDEWMRLALSYEWRVASATAHARSWPMQVRKTEALSARGVDVRRMTSSVEELAKSVGVAVLMTSEAWRLWDLRREKHTK